MHLTPTLLALPAVVLEGSLAYPSRSDWVAEHVKRYDSFSDDLAQRLGSYQAPGPTDSRGPCPGLNTLANHGLINRNGKNLNSSDIKTAFPRAFGIAEDAIETALHNYEVVCEYIKGTTCGTAANDGTFILTNLTILGEPPAFEHDYSYSRQDYRQNWAHGGIADNIYFNSSEMQAGLNVVGYKRSNPPKVATASYQQFNEVRLQRESTQNQNDFPGWFQQNIPPTLFETGFIFGATFDRDSSGTMKESTPMARLDWWNFWFSEESFPTQLGWVPASTEVFNNQFCLSVSSAVLHASVSSTPKSLPAGATATTFPPPANLPEGDPSPTLALFQSPPYAAPTAPTATKTAAAAAKRAALPEPQASSLTLPASVSSIVASEVTARPSLIQAALQLAGSAPLRCKLYQQSIDTVTLKNQMAAAQSY
ncbi:hypothetical protein B0A55_00163 [Friedmanniomyces simplex]|uniref:Heme haloperoxidase family profile domain-containing protein n=1 Tax=Friedmanniomyces simplex TaxID=329884 RepID=A0A4U0Y5I6_9PEZI|nr:hypothetical protein B0A55_00163 [Friedmanniomyces simplex]